MNDRALPNRTLGSGDGVYSAYPTDGWTGNVLVINKIFTNLKVNFNTYITPSLYNTSQHIRTVRRVHVSHETFLKLESKN